MFEEIGDDYVRACREADVRIQREREERAEAARVARPNKGDVVVIVKGGKKNRAGTMGTLFWINDITESFGYGSSTRDVTRVGIRLADESVAWDYMHNVRKFHQENG